MFVARSGSQGSPSSQVYRISAHKKTAGVGGGYQNGLAAIRRRGR